MSSALVASSNSSTRGFWTTPCQAPA
jgi:hypothetical protein